MDSIFLKNNSNYEMSEMSPINHLSIIDLEGGATINSELLQYSENSAIGTDTVQMERELKRIFENATQMRMAQNGGKRRMNIESSDSDSSLQFGGTSEESSDSDSISDKRSKAGKKGAKKQSKEGKSKGGKKSKKGNTDSDSQEGGDKPKKEAPAGFLAFRKIAQHVAEIAGKKSVNAKIMSVAKKYWIQAKEKNGGADKKFTPKEYETVIKDANAFADKDASNIKSQVQ
jgi:hypothetical protein